MSQRAFNKIITKEGEVVTVRPRQATGDATTSSPRWDFPEALWFKTRALKYDASGLREDWYVIGTDTHVDYVLSFYAHLKDNIAIHDLVELEDGDVLEVVNIVKRGKGSSIDHLEILARRVDYG